MLQSHKRAVADIKAAAAGSGIGRRMWRWGEGVGAREGAKGQLQGLRFGFIERGGREGATAGVMAMAGWSSQHSRGRGLDGGETVGDEGGGVNPELNCTLMRAIQGGEARDTRGGGRWQRCTAKQGRGTGGGRWCRQEGPTCQRVKARGRMKLGRCDNPPRKILYYRLRLIHFGH
jgi:hypothetical protein